MLTALTDPFVDDVIKSNPFRNDYEIEGDIGAFYSFSLPPLSRLSPSPLTSFLHAIDSHLSTSRIYTSLTLHLIDKLFSGKGNYGCVLRVKKRNTGQYYAIKVTELQCESNNACTIPATTLREINSIRMIKSDHVIEYHGFDKTDRYIFVLTDHANTDLQDYLKSLRAYLPLRKLKNFLYQILSGLTDVHAAGMCHRDVKPANILLYKDARQEFGYTLKLADFGLGRDLVRPVRPTSPCVVTCYYRAPEVFLKQESMCMSSMDVWSVGICMIREYIFFTSFHF